MFEFFWRRKASVWLAVLYIVLGLPLVIYPDLSGRIFCWCLAGGSVVYASSHLWRYVEGRQEGYPAVSDLALAIVFFILGLFCFFGYRVILSILPVALGVVLLIDGVGKLPLLMEERRHQLGIFRPLLFSTLLPLVFGVVLLVNPFGVTKLVIRFFGISLVADGICDLITVITSRGKLRRM